MKKNVLIVDDQAPVCHLFAQCLQRAGYDPVTACSGEDALDILLHTNIQVMFLDLRMPGMDGIELCRAIRARNPVACIYAVTGYTTLFELTDCREAGFDDYFPKPLDPQTLIDTARDAFNKLERWTGQSQDDAEALEEMEL